MSRFLRAAIVFLVPVIVCIAAAYVASRQMPTLRAAEADVAFDPGDRGDVLEKILATQAVVAKSHAVLAPVADSLGVPTTTLDRKLSVDFPKSGVVLRLTYTDGSPDTALTVLDAITTQYLNVLDRMKFLSATKYVMVPPFVLSEPVWPKPVQAMALGAALGLAIGIAALALEFRLRTRVATA